MSRQKIEMSLKSFYIFNPIYGPSEGEEEKQILFYYPPDTDTNNKIKDVGLTEAIIKFTNTFTFGDDSCETFRTQKSAHFFYQPEKDYWMIMAINVPYEKKKVNEIDYNEYRGDDVHSKIFMEVLRQSYRMFRIFFGTFQLNASGSTLEERSSNLIPILELFYSKYVLTLKLHRADILDVIRGVQYLPVTKLLFLRINNFIKMIQSTFSNIKCCIFLYNEQVIWNEINPIDLSTIYEYLISTLIPKASQKELLGGSLTRTYSLDSTHYGQFLTGPDNMENCVNVPKIFIYKDNEYKTYYLIVYRAFSATICLFVDDSNVITDDFYQELCGFIGPQLTSIASEIGDNFTNTLQITEHQSVANASPIMNNAKYLYFNGLDLKYNGTIHQLDQNKKTKSKIPSEIMNLIVDICDNDHDNDFIGSINNNNNNSNIDTINSNKSKTKEIVLKTLNDYWIVYRSSNFRHFYVVINQNSTLLEITEEAKKIFEQKMNHCFF